MAFKNIIKPGIVGQEGSLESIFDEYVNKYKNKPALRIFTLVHSLKFT